MNKKAFTTARDNILKKTTDEQLRILRIEIGKELEIRLETAEKKYFKHRAIA